MNRRKFLSYVGCGCCGIILPSCTTAPITERKQLKIVYDDEIVGEYDLLASIEVKKSKFCFKIT
ncbi:hypothetical protein IDH26_01710 [Pelagibacterales bacterium SAG-MED50]|nr:hypothetical protein [Pelagibacterales bacterium SAG-MED50]